VLETYPYFRVPLEVAYNKSLSRRERDLQTKPRPILIQIEFVCNVFFATEILLRFLFSPSKLKFIRNLYHFLEFLAILPLFWPSNNYNIDHMWGVDIHNYIQFLYILRVLRIFTIVPKYSALRVLLLTLKHSIRELILYVVMLLMTIMFYGTLIFYAEQIYENEKNRFDSIPIGLWYAVVTMTTLGYGDVVPSGPVGYIVGAACAISGLIFTALPIPVIVNNFTVFYTHAKATQQLKQFAESEAHKGLVVKARTTHLQMNESILLERKIQEINLGQNAILSETSILDSSNDEDFGFKSEENKDSLNVLEMNTKKRSHITDAKS
jgi:potassium voltage-gated channel Shaw-related subfamily C protein 1